MVEETNSGTQSPDVIHNSKIQLVHQQTTFSGLICETDSNKTTTIIGKGASISPKKSKKSTFDCSAIFMQSNLLKYDESDYIPKDVVISDEDVLKAREIRLVEHEGHLFSNSTLVINPLGIKNHCQRRDSISYFWLHPSVSLIK